MVDAVLIACMEKNISIRNVFRETAIREDTKNLSLNPLFNGFINRYRENLGIACLAAYLRQNNIPTKIINSNIENKSNRQIEDEILADNPVMVGFSILYELHLYNTMEVIFNLRKRGYKGHITIGGPCASFIYEFLLNSTVGIDSVILGEGELPMLTLVNRLKSKQSWKDIDGLAYMHNGEAVYNQKKETISDLSILPFAARDSLYYLKNQGYSTRTASIYSSRGCRGNCIYCTAPSSSCLELEKWRCRSGESLYEEVEFLVKEFGVEYLYFCDVNFIGYGSKALERLEVFCNKIIENNIKINFHAEIRVDSIKPDLLNLLKKAGLRDLLLGLESGSQRLLNLWRKGVTVERNLRAVETVKNHGFMLEPAMIMVSPSTTKQDLVDTIDFIVESKIYEDNVPMNMFNKMVLFRGSEAERLLRDEGKLDSPDMSVITKPVKNENDLVAICKEMLAREYKIFDDDVEKVWEVLVPYINKLTWLIQDYFPDYMSSEFRQMRSNSNKKESRQEILTKIIGIKKWRAQIGELIKNILLATKECLSKNEVNVGEFSRGIARIIDEYEIECFGDILKTGT